ncbi:MAG TPA: DUF3024 domain-containing protein [Candidatus Limnocylindria bacterium]|nr:DUF3024 domain-containing protein [Candidatus Limnocylindria bacterium]
MDNAKRAVPDLDIARIRRYCDGKVPAHLRDKIRIEFDVRGRSVTILECRPPWTPAIGPEWTRMPIARLRFLAGRGVWLLDWSDRNSRWHHYDDIEPSPHVDPLLAEIEEDPTSIFWG